VSFWDFQGGVWGRGDFAFWNHARGGGGGCGVRGRGGVRFCSRVRGAGGWAGGVGGI